MESVTSVLKIAEAAQQIVVFALLVREFAEINCVKRPPLNLPATVLLIVVFAVLMDSAEVSKMPLTAPVIALVI